MSMHFVPSPCSNLRVRKNSMLKTSGTASEIRKIVEALFIFICCSCVFSTLFFFCALTRVKWIKFGQETRVNDANPRSVRNKNLSYFCSINHHHHLTMLLPVVVYCIRNCQITPSFESRTHDNLYSNHHFRIFLAELHIAPSAWTGRDGHTYFLFYFWAAFKQNKNVVIMTLSSIRQSCCVRLHNESVNWVQFLVRMEFCTHSSITQKEFFKIKKIRC